MGEYIKYRSTVGLNTWIGEKLTLVKVFFGKREDNGTWDAWVESARSGGKIRKFKTKSLSVSEFNDLQEDCDIEFARKCFAIFGLEV